MLRIILLLLVGHVCLDGIPVRPTLKQQAVANEINGEKENWTYQISEEQIVYQPKDFWIDGPYFTYRWQGQVYGVLPSDYTSRTKDFVGAKIRHRELMKGLEKGKAGNWDELGAWLNGIYQDDKGRLHGYYHGESRKDPISKTRNKASLGYAYSDDGGKTWIKPNYPNNKIITGQNGQDYAGDGHLVIRKDYLYFYYGQTDGERLALSRLQDKGLPGTWNTYVRSNKPGKIHTVPSMKANGSELFGLRYGAFVAWNTYLKKWLAVDGDLNGLKDNKLILKVSSDGITWSKLSSSSSPLLQHSFPGQILYPSLVGIDGETETGKQFWLYYIYLGHPNILARVKVTLSSSSPIAPRTEEQKPTASR